MLRGTALQRMEQPHERPRQRKLVLPRLPRAFAIEFAIEDVQCPICGASGGSLGYCHGWRCRVVRSRTPE